ncbi:MAG: hypothetical protein ACOZNI_21215 [Myxococcota bacterium]
MRGFASSTHRFVEARHCAAGAYVVPGDVEDALAREEVPTRARDLVMRVASLVYDLEDEEYRMGFVSS